MYLSDGSERLHTLDGATLSTLLRTVPVTDGGRAVGLLNELETVGGLVYANVWLTECLAIIDPATGFVTAWALLHGLRASLPPRAAGAPEADVLNGVAWDAAGGRLFVTGKHWPLLFHIELAEQNATGAALRRARGLCNGGGRHGL